MPSERRRHPLSILFGLGSSLRQFLVPWLVAMFFSRPGRGMDVWLAFLVVPASVAAVVSWLTFRWQVTAGELVLRRGLLARSVRHIPVGRIQDVSLRQAVLHRLFGVADVRVETASGGDEVEARISVLSLAEAEELRAWVRSSKAQGGAAPEGAAGGEIPAPPPPEPVLEVPASDLALLGLTSNRGTALAVAAFGFLSQYWAGDDPEAWRRAAPLVGRIHLGLVEGLLLLLGILLLLRLLSVAWTVQHLYGFRVLRDGDSYQISHGLFSRTLRTVPRRRIHRVVLREGPIHRLFSRTTVLATTAGTHGRQQGEEGHQEEPWLAPMLPSGGVPAFLRSVLPEVDLDAATWQPLSRRAAGRLFRRWSLRVLLLALALALLGLWPVSVVLLVLTVPLWPLARLAVRRAGIAVLPGGVAVRTGAWTRILRAARHARVQAVSLAQSPFDRRARMATLVVDTAVAGRGAHRLRLPYLDLEEAVALHRRLADQAGGTAFVW